MKGISTQIKTVLAIVLVLMILGITFTVLYKIIFPAGRGQTALREVNELVTELVGITCTTGNPAVFDLHMPLNFGFTLHRHLVEIPENLVKEIEEVCRDKKCLYAFRCANPSCSYKKLLKCFVLDCDYEIKLEGGCVHSRGDYFAAMISCVPGVHKVGMVGGCEFESVRISRIEDEIKIELSECKPYWL